jgi:hypothetical protein
MSYRPYPNAERAMKQLDRHYPATETAALEYLIPTAESFARLRASAQQAAERRFGLDEYRMSTRGPAVSGEL